MDMVIEGCRAVVPSDVIEGASVYIKEGIIEEISRSATRGCKRKIQADGLYLMPGFIDLHSDAIEREISPRPNVSFPVNIALFELDKRLAASGITTIFHSLSFAEGEIGIRSNKIVCNIIKEINRLKSTLNINTMVHARYEITDASAMADLKDLLGGGKIDLLSIMDHTPGQGQFREIASYKHYFGNMYNKTETELDRIIEQKMESKRKVNGNVKELINACRKSEIPLASHDDDSAEKVKWLKENGIGISEFPVNMEALKATRDAGIKVCLGAPNVFRGSSQANNLSARDAIMAGCGDILCSDYTPMTMLHAVFTLVDLKILSLHEAVKMASLNPASAVGTGTETGSIEEGKRADMILVNTKCEVSAVTRTFVSGNEIYRSV
jgi:Metal-dependent hydrolase involved in phosphonate metabolism